MQCRVAPGGTWVPSPRTWAAVHRWARSALTQPRPDERSDDGPGPGVDLRTWFDDGARALVATLRSTDPATECWTFGPRPRTAAFWFRRQAHETAMHAWDAARARTDTPPPFDLDLALDGVDELVTMFVPRQIRLGRLAPLQDVVELGVVDAPEATTWRLAPTGPVAGDAPGREPDAVVSAPRHHAPAPAVAARPPRHAGGAGDGRRRRRPRPAGVTAHAVKGLAGRRRANLTPRR